MLTLPNTSGPALSPCAGLQALRPMRTAEPDCWLPIGCLEQECQSSRPPQEQMSVNTSASTKGRTAVSEIRVWGARSAARLSETRLRHEALIGRGHRDASRF
ncbi:hypothetical protein AAFF_G00062610 [Aldrovandia affinis]|uniref:Uncharacterized protein n=1 Tax=Aldrovandia affinis TaxID=143900 RepID=A0AAD7RZG3_9TELE|nr:hypothetical protein AAFF_G00062610 [Aldrovandia affinis]